MVCVGIDLGTTNSLVAVFEDDGPRLLPNALGDYLTPSVVGLSDDGKSLLVGRAARMRLLRHPDRTVARFKRWMGTDHTVTLGTARYTPVDLSALMLKTLKADAEAALGVPVTEAVISVPAYFNGVQRQATKDAAEIAGLTVRRLINEPTAAALAAGVLDRDGESTFAILDLGGGTFDVSILEMFDGVIEVRSSSGDARLGGEDMTEAVARKLAKDANLVFEWLEPKVREKLFAVSEDLKRKVGADRPVSADVELDGTPVTLSLSAEALDDLVQPFLRRMRRPIDICMHDAALSVEDIDRVILVGGATRMAAVQSLAARLFGKLPLRVVDPDHAIALGAAVQAGLVSRHAALDDVVMTDVAPFSLGLETTTEMERSFLTGRFEPLIERNTILPASRAGRFFTLADNQTRIVLRVFQGEAALVKDNVALGELSVQIPARPKGREGLEVRFTYDVSGLLEVEATVLSTGQKLSKVIDNLASAMTEEEKAARLKALAALKVHPSDLPENVALLETLRSLFEMTLGRQRHFIQSMIGEFETVLAGQDPKAIEVERQKLAEIAREIEDDYVR